MIDFIKEDDSEAKLSNSIKLSSSGEDDSGRLKPMYQRPKIKATQENKNLIINWCPGFKLVPEIALIESLPEHLQKNRFY
ncbi:hypothetical protein O9929_23605 [Vibrio lentus]|nr:hypothetical protein [Vibrio lentus]